MKEYLDLLRKVHDQGSYRGPARDGMPSSQNLFGEMIEIDLRKGFPLLTTKKMAWNAIVTELLWFLRGESNLRYLWSITYISGTKMLTGSIKGGLNKLVLRIV